MSSPNRGKPVDPNEAGDTSRRNGTMLNVIRLLIAALGFAPVVTPSERRGFRFRLFSSRGDDVGEYETAAPKWCAGDEFSTGDGRRFRLLGIVLEFEGAGRYNAFWSVAPLD